MCFLLQKYFKIASPGQYEWGCTSKNKHKALLYIIYCNLLSSPQGQPVYLSWRVAINTLCILFLRFLYKYPSTCDPLSLSQLTMMDLVCHLKPLFSTAALLWREKKTLLVGHYWKMFHLLEGLIELVVERCVITCSIACGSYTQLMFCSGKYLLALWWAVALFHIFGDVVIQCVISA